MFSSIVLAFGDLFDRRIIAITVMSLVITLAIFAALGLALTTALNGADPCDFFDFGTCTLDSTTSAFGSIAFTLLAMWLMFPAIAVGVIAGFGDRIVTAVETRHYPQSLTAARPLGATGMALLGLRSSGRLILANLIALPFYLILLVTGIGPVVLFVLVNGWAVGRDFGEMVSYRHGDRDARYLWLRASRGERTGIGILCACLFLVPFLNLLAPILGVAAVTHLYHRADARRIAGA